MNVHPVTKEWRVLRHATASYKLHRRHYLGSKREAWEDSLVHAIAWEEQPARCECSPNKRNPTGRLRRLSRELKCRLGIHELITYRTTTGTAWAECYQSDRCRGRTHAPR